MDAKSETKKLAEATASLAGTIVEIIEARLKASLESQTSQLTSSSNAIPFKPSEGWVRKTDVAKHLSISLRTVNNWMRKGHIPYIRLGGRKNLFKLSEVDEALKRRFQMNSRW